MNKKQLLEQLRNDIYCRLAPSKVHGVGVFAIKDIDRGIDPFKGADNSRYVKIKKEQLKGLDKSVFKLFDDMFVFDKGIYWMPAKGLQSIDISYYINHSKNPNMIAEEQGEKFVTKRNIRKGEELLIDYDTYDAQNHNYGSNPMKGAKK